jgi:hypothetical protein
MDPQTPRDPEAAPCCHEPGSPVGVAPRPEPIAHPFPGAGPGDPTTSSSELPAPTSVSGCPNGARTPALAGSSSATCTPEGTRGAARRAGHHAAPRVSPSLFRCATMVDKALFVVAVCVAMGAGALQVRCQCLLPLPRLRLGAPSHTTMHHDTPYLDLSRSTPLATHLWPPGNRSGSLRGVVTHTGAPPAAIVPQRRGRQHVALIPALCLLPPAMTAAAHLHPPLLPPCGVPGPPPGPRRHPRDTVIRPGLCVPGLCSGHGLRMPVCAVHGGQRARTVPPPPGVHAGVAVPGRGVGGWAAPRGHCRATSRVRGSNLMCRPLLGLQAAFQVVCSQSVHEPLAVPPAMAVGGRVYVWVFVGVWGGGAGEEEEPFLPVTCRIQLEAQSHPPLTSHSTM